MRKQLYISLLAAILALPLLTRAEEVVVSDTIEAVIDSIVVDEDSIPEWYVAPVIPEELRSPMRATASGCLTDSILTFNADSILTEATIYDYDASNRTIRTTIWKYDVNGGILSTSSKTEYGFDSRGTQIYTASFTWNTATNNWKGSSKSEFVYNEAHKMESQITYTWVNNTWLPQNAYTYVWDALGRQTEYTTYSRDANVNHLIPSTQLVNVWNGTSTSQKSQEIYYTAYSNGAWSAGNRKDYQYDANGNQIEYTYYSSYSSGNWIGSTQEFWTYNASKKKTYYEKKTWSNGDWVNSQKEIWEFNTAGKQTLHKKYSGAGSDWTITANDSSVYDAAGNNILVENYTYTNGVAKGSKKEEYTYNDKKKKINTYKYKWVAADNAWVYNTWAVTDFDAAGNATETANYNWKNNGWVGSGTRTLKTYNSSKKVTEQITQTWPTGETNWVNKTCTTTTYSGAKTLMEAYYTWQDNDWLGTSRKDYHYNAAGLNDTTKTYTNNGTDWIYSNRTINTYNAAGEPIMTHNSSWNGTSWQLISMTRTDKIVDAAGHVLLNASWRCESDSVWIGISKDTAAYLATGDVLYSERYDLWSDNAWVPTYKVENEYDESNRLTLNQRLDWESGRWKGHYRYEYAYDTYGNVISSASYNNWNYSSSSWIGTTKSETEYDASGELEEYTISYIWGGSDWIVLNKTIFTYDAFKNVIEQIIQNYNNGTWVNSFRYEKAYKGSSVIKSNDYTWVNNAWQITRQSEKIFDNDAQGKLRRDITGSWNTSGVATSYKDLHYFYSCDAPASNGSQPRTPTDIEEIDENNGTYENNENNAQPFDSTQPTYNLSGQRVDPAGYHGLVIQSGHTYYLP